MDEPEANTHRAFTAVPGDVVRIGHHGQASNDSPALIPERVAQELSTSPRFRVEAIDTEVVSPPPRRSRKRSDEDKEE